MRPATAAPRQRIAASAGDNIIQSDCNDLMALPQTGIRANVVQEGITLGRCSDVIS